MAYNDTNLHPAYNNIDQSSRTMNCDKDQRITNNDANNDDENDKIKKKLVAFRPDLEPKTKGISNPHPHDILCGRGNAVNRHVGNVFFRKIVSCRKPEYRMGAYPIQRRKVAYKVYEEIQNLNPPGRFLMLKGSEWSVCDETKAMCKISQALRELASNDPVDVDTLQNKFSSALLSNVMMEAVNSSGPSIPSLTSSSNSANKPNAYQGTGVICMSSNVLNKRSEARDNKCVEENAVMSSPSVLTVSQVDIENLQNKSSSSSGPKPRMETFTSSSASIPSLTSSSNISNNDNALLRRRYKEIDISRKKIDVVSQIRSQMFCEKSIAESSSSVQNHESIASESSNLETAALNAPISTLLDENQHLKSSDHSELHSKGTKISFKKSPPRQQSCEVLSQHNEDEDSQQQLNVTPDNQENKPIKKRLRDANQGLGKQLKVQKRPPEHQQVIMPLSYIGRSFANSICSDESKDIFQEVADLGQHEDALLYLPSIIGSLCKRVVELEDEVHEND